eukprot:6725833-Heterocapsa_arctica.AAC.1
MAHALSTSSWLTSSSSTRFMPPSLPLSRANRWFRSGSGSRRGGSSSVFSSFRFKSEAQTV